MLLFCVRLPPGVSSVLHSFIFISTLPSFAGPKNGVRVVSNGPSNARQAFCYSSPKSCPIFLLQGGYGERWWLHKRLIQYRGANNANISGKAHYFTCLPNRRDYIWGVNWMFCAGHAVCAVDITHSQLYSKFTAKRYQTRCKFARRCFALYLVN